MAYSWANLSDLPPIYLFDSHMSKEALRYADNLGQALLIVPPYELTGQHQSGLIIGHMIDRLRKRCENFKNCINCQRMLIMKTGDYYCFQVKQTMFDKYLNPETRSLLTRYDPTIHQLDFPEMTAATAMWL